MQTPTYSQMEAAAKVMNDNGTDIKLPWECSVDDVELARFEALEAAIGAALEADGWRLIATIPPSYVEKGTHFLACDARVPYGEHWGFDQRPPTVVHWWGDPGEEGFYTSVNELEPQHPFNATHWMALGKPPGGNNAAL